MALGPGKYDDLCTYVRQQAKAGGACVMVFNGEKGWGFSVQCPPEALLDLSGVLRHISDTIRADAAKDLREIHERN
jgi:hypothetical protein